MKNLSKNIILICGLGLSISATTVSCSDDIADEVTTVNYSRLFSPVDFTAVTRQRTNILLKWQKVRKATSYEIEVYKDDAEMAFDGTAFQKVTYTPTEGDNQYDELSYTLERMEGSTDFSIRIKAITDNAEASKWVAATVRTEDENYFNDAENITHNQVTISWDNNITVTHIRVFKSSSDETALQEIVPNDSQLNEGKYTVTGLSPETNYSIKIYRMVNNEEKVCGTQKITTDIDLEGGIAIYAGATETEVQAAIDAAEDNTKLFLLPSKDGSIATFSTNVDGKAAPMELKLTKSIILKGSQSKPVTIDAIFSIEGAGNLTLENLTFKSSDSGKYFLTYLTPKAESNFTMRNCTINTYKSVFQETDNSKVTIMGKALIESCTITNIGERFVNFQKKKIHFKEFVFTKSTVLNCKINSFFRFDYDKARTGASYEISNSTFYNIAGLSEGFTYIRSNKAGDVAFGCNVKANFFHTVSAGGGMSKDGKTDGVSFTDNWYYNSADLTNEAMKVHDDKGKTTTVDPCPNAEKGNLMLDEGEVNDAKVGNPALFHK